MSLLPTKIYNLVFSRFNVPDSFELGPYRFSKQNSSNQNTVRVYDSVRDWRDHRWTMNACVIGKEQASVIHEGGKLIDNRTQAEIPLTFIEDILLLASLFLGRNVGPEYRFEGNEWPSIARNHLEPIAKDHNELEACINLAEKSLSDKKWQKEFVHGFHLRMLYNASNILTRETRFLAYFVIWEWLYARLAGKEENNLRKIVAFVLKHFWNDKFKAQLFNENSNNVFQTLRNQLAHNGMLPITRGDAWMRKIAVNTLTNVYIPFFMELTQTIVFKTLSINCENSIHGFTGKLDAFLSSGSVVTDL